MVVIIDRGFARLTLGFAMMVMMSEVVTPNPIPNPNPYGIINMVVIIDPGQEGTGRYR